MTTTATITAAATLTARVIVHGTKGNRLDVEIITGTGGWNAPGKRIWVFATLASDIRDETPATPVAAPVAEETPAAPVETTESAELTAARAEVVRIQTALVANFLHPSGGRGKQGLRRTDAAIRRGAKFSEELKKAHALVSALESPRPVVATTPVEVPRTATAVRTRFGWHKVVRVNAKSVTVKTPYSWTDRIAIGNIIDFR